MQRWLLVLGGGMAVVTAAWAAVVLDAGYAPGTPGFGDAMGPVAGLASVAALFAALWSVGLQREALEATREELRLQREEFALQRKEFEGQRHAQEEVAAVQTADLELRKTEMELRALAIEAQLATDASDPTTAMFSNRKGVIGDRVRQILVRLGAEELPPEETELGLLDASSLAPLEERPPTGERSG